MVLDDDTLVGLYFNYANTHSEFLNKLIDGEIKVHQYLEECKKMDDLLDRLSMKLSIGDFKDYLFTVHNLSATGDWIHLNEHLVTARAYNMSNARFGIVEGDGLHFSLLFDYRAINCRDWEAEKVVEYAYNYVNSVRYQSKADKIISKSLWGWRQRMNI